MKVFLFTIYIPWSAEDDSVTVLDPLHFQYCICQLWVVEISFLAEVSWA